MALAERVCPACGYCPPVGMIDEDLTGDLRQIDEQMIMEAMMAERPYRELLGLARSREHLRLIARPAATSEAGSGTRPASWACPEMNRSTTPPLPPPPPSPPPPPPPPSPRGATILGPLPAPPSPGVGAYSHWSLCIPPVQQFSHSVSVNW